MGRLLNISLDDKPSYPTKKDTTATNENISSEVNAVDEPFLSVYMKRGRDRKRERALWYLFS